MRKQQVLGFWLIWLLGAVHSGAASGASPKQHNKNKGKAYSQKQQQQQQQPIPSFLELFAATSAPALSAYESVHKYNHSLPLPLLQNGLVYRGSAARLRRVVRRLLHNEPVSIGVVGSSISYGKGVQRGTSDWFTLFSAWLQAAFPAAKVTARNGAVPLARSEFISACLEHHVDTNADLVFIEVTAADGYLDTSINNELVHAFERLARKLLNLPHQPAVVLLNALHTGSLQSNSPQQQPPQPQQQQPKPAARQATSSLGLGNKQQQQPQQQAKSVQRQQQRGQGQQPATPFYHTIEDHYGVVAQYYELPCLSLRNAAWQGLLHGWEGFSTRELFADDAKSLKHDQQSNKQRHQQQHTQQSNSSRKHESQPSSQQQQQRRPQADPLPTALGHKYMADLAVSLLQRTFVHELLRPLGPSDAAAADKLPVPMFSGNWEGHGSGCAGGVDLRAAVRDDHKDWYFVTEGNPEHPRWGFVSHVPNATLLLQLDTRSKGATRAVAALTRDQKVELLQRHGLFAAAAELIPTEGLPLVPPVPVGLPPADAASMQIWQGNGLESAMAEAERQAAAAAVQLRLGQAKPFVNSERVVGVNPYSTLQLPQEARLEVGKTKTATGVEVIMPGGRRLQGDAAAPLQQQEEEEEEEEKVHHTPTVGVDSSGNNGELRFSSSRALTSADNPLVVPPPYDAVYLKPPTDGSSSSSSTGGSTASSTSPSSNATTSALAPGTVGASVFSEYSFTPQPRMVVLVGFLKAPRMMGRARIFCMSGCSCREVVVDGWHAHHQHRLATAWLHVTQSPECTVGVQVLPDTSTGHHKFKVTGVMVTHSVHYRSVGSEWAHQYFLHPDLLTE